MEKAGKFFEKNILLVLALLLVLIFWWYSHHLEETTVDSSVPYKENVITIYFNDGTILDKSIRYSGIKQVLSEGTLIILNSEGEVSKFSYVKFYELNPYKEGVNYFYNLSD